MRRGDTREIEETGSSWKAAATHCMWNFQARRGYLDLAPDVEAGVRSLIRGVRILSLRSVRINFPVFGFVAGKPIGRANPDPPHG